MKGTALLSLATLAFAHSHDLRIERRASQATDNRPNNEWQAAQAKIALIRGALSGTIRAAWEHGTAIAVTEFDYPDVGAFGSSPFKSNTILPASALAYAASAVTHGADDGRLAISALDDSSQLDSVSCGSGVILGAGTDHQNAIAIDWKNRTSLLRDFIFTEANRTSCGAISHRSDYITYWDDGTRTTCTGMYMSSSALSALALANNDQEALTLAANNLEIYWQTLYRPDQGLLGHWRNDLGVCGYPNGSAGWIDNGTWATGNMWAAGGQLRVINAIQKQKNPSKALKAALTNLTSHIDELLTNQAKHQISGLLSNRPDNAQTFGESASSALWAYCAYRLAQIMPSKFNKFVPQADEFRKAVLADVSPIGELKSAVNVLEWYAPGAVSSEAQSFAILMMAAWRDLNGLA